MVRGDFDTNGDNIKAAIIGLVMKLMKSTYVDSKSMNSDTRVFVLTSNICENLFVVSGHEMTNKEKEVLPAYFESHLFFT